MEIEIISNNSVVLLYVNIVAIYRVSFDYTIPPPMDSSTYSNSLLYSAIAPVHIVTQHYSIIQYYYVALSSYYINFIISATVLLLALLYYYHSSTDITISMIIIVIIIIIIIIIIDIAISIIIQD